MYKRDLKKIIDIKNRIEESIATRRPLIFTYIKRHEYIPEERRVFFQSIYSKNEHLYAAGYCLMRKAGRTFRLDRIEKIIGFDTHVGEILFDVEVPEVPAGAVAASERLEEIKRDNNEKRAETRGCLITFIVVLIVCGGLVFGYLLGNYPGVWDKVLGKRYDYYTQPSPVSYIEVRGQKRSLTKPEQVKQGDIYRGYAISTKDASYTIEGIAGKFKTMQDALVMINREVFIKTTGIDEDKLLAIYLEADQDGTGSLSWEEITHFQLQINRQFKYIQNSTALRPDEFLASGGGDCEDWALFTAGLLRFWNYEPYIGSLNFKDHYHAITIVKVRELPYRYRGYRINRAFLDSGEAVPQGLYTCIDYYRVGRLTRAGGRKPRLTGISLPEWCYGKSL